MQNICTYTFGLLKENIYKALEEFSLNGAEISLSSGIAADIEKRLISVLNQCARRVSLSLPLIEQKAELVFMRGSDGKHFSALPENYYGILALYNKNRCKISDGHYYVSDGFLYATASKRAIPLCLLIPLR